MISTPAQVAEFQKSQLDALFALSHTMFEATEKLVDLNLAATKANYYRQERVNPTCIVPKGPDMSFLDVPHDRGRLPAAA